MLGFEKRGWSIQEPFPMKSTLYFWDIHILLKIHEYERATEYIIPGFGDLRRDKIDGISLAFRGHFLIRNNYWLPFIHYSKLGE